MKRFAPPLVRGQSQPRNTRRAIEKVRGLFRKGEVADETVDTLLWAERRIADGIAAQWIARTVGHLSSGQRNWIGIWVGNVVNINAEQIESVQLPILILAA